MKSLKNLKSWKYKKLLKNNRYNFKRSYVLKHLPSTLITNAFKSISSWKNYKATPLLSLDKLNKNLKLNNIFYKDESKRFHLKSFKALGGAYAVEKISKGKKNIIISSATAGNHGRSVAWGAKKLGLKCKIFISEYVSEFRANVMRSFGADVIRVKGNYDNSLKECIKKSKQNNWQIVQDVAWQDYKLVPKLTMAGYSVMMKEISEQINNQKISHVILQAGVGGMAAAMIAGIANYLNHVPKIIIVEPESAACVLESIKTGKIEKISIKKESCNALEADTINDDFILPMRAVIKGGLSVLDSDIRILETESTPLAQDAERRLRISQGNMQQLIRLRALLLPGIKLERIWASWMFFSGKTLRVIMPYILMSLLVFSALLATESILFMLLFFSQVSVYLIAIIHQYLNNLQSSNRFFNNKLVKVISYLCQGHLMGFIGSASYLLNSFKQHVLGIAGQQRWHKLIIKNK